MVLHPLLWAPRPFTLDDARAAGLDEAELRRLLRRGDARPVCRAVYVGANVPDSLQLRAEAHLRVLPPGTAVSHDSAAELWGVDVTPTERAETPRLTVTVPPPSRPPRRAGVRVIGAGLDEGSVVRRRRVLVTSPERTAADLMCERGLVEAVVVADSLAHAWPAVAERLPGALEAIPYRRGLVRARQALPHVEPLSESPMETRLRMLLVQAGLDRPVAQVVVRHRGRFVARLDLAYPRLRLGLEYDGRAAHPAGFARDRERGNALDEAGWVVLHFAAEDVLRHPERTVALVSRLVRSQELRRDAGWIGCAY